MAPSGTRRELFLLATTEAWERFSYYGIRGLLVLFLTASATTGGMDWSRDSALQLLGWFVALVYVVPVLGGWCGDRLTGARLAVRIGTAVLVVAYALLAASAWLQQNLHSSTRCVDAVYTGLRTVVCSGLHPRTLMLAALVLIAIGTGFFKPNVTALVGRLYRKDDPAREGGFLLFYLFMNIGVVLCGLVIGTLGERVAWHFGFLAASAAMVLSAFVFSMCRPESSSPPIGNIAPPRVAPRTAIPLSGSERAALALLGILGIFATLFWVGLEQTAGLLNLFAFENTAREFGGVTIPATWFQSLNPLFVFVLAPAFTVLWGRLAARGADPRTEWKFVLGLVAMACAFAVMDLAARHPAGESLASPAWLVATYFLLTVSELCIWTISLAAVTRHSPQRYEGLIVGLWYLAIAVGGWGAGQIGALTVRLPMDEVFALLSRMFLVGAVVLAAVTPVTRRLARRAAAA